LQNGIRLNEMAGSEWISPLATVGLGEDPGA